MFSALLFLQEAVLRAFGRARVRRLDPEVIA
jgi:hypothetical protein